MPGMSGLELARRHLSLHPKSKILYMSGYTDDSLVRQNGFEQDAVFLQKPFSMETLARRLRDLLDGRGGNNRKVFFTHSLKFGLREMNSHQRVLRWGKGECPRDRWR